MEEEKNAQETVTIVMPVYNPGKYLVPCLDSLLAQTFRDFRLIAIDDGSTDGSGEVLRAYAAKDDRILAWRNPENLGAARTRNIGIQMAKGRYLSVVDADDFYEPDYLETMVEAMEQYGVDVVECDFFVRDERMGAEWAGQSPPCLTVRMGKPFCPEDEANQIFRATHNNPFTHMVRRQFVMDHALQFQDISSCNDIYFMKMAILYAGNVIHIFRPLVHYRNHTGQQISTTRFRTPENFFRACGAMRTELIAHKTFLRYAPAFHDFVIATIRSTFPSLKEHFGMKIFDILKRELHGLGMDRMRRKDFSSPLTYQYWKAVQQGDIPAYESCLPVFYEDFFQHLRERRYTVGLWGYGNLGRKFLQEAQRCGFHVGEVYDRDQAKWRQNSNLTVCSFDERQQNPDIVVVTNSAFYPEIQAEVRTKSKDTYVYDFTSYINFGALEGNFQYGKGMLSILVPVYQVKDYLCRCVDSLLRQSVKLEVWLVDDGSTDGSGEICDHYAERDARVRVIHKENGGLSSARLTGIRAAQGEYLAFVDSDDWVDDDLFAKLIKPLEEDDSIDISMGGYVSENDLDRWHDVPLRALGRVYSAREAIHQMFRMQGFTWSLCSKVYRKNLFEHAAFLERWPHGYGEDSFISYHLMQHIRKAAYVPTAGYHYYMRETSLTHQTYHPARMAYFEIYDEIIADARDKDPELAQVLLSVMVIRGIPMRQHLLEKKIYPEDAERMRQYFQKWYPWMEDHIWTPRLRWQWEYAATISWEAYQERRRQWIEYLHQLSCTCDGLYLYGAGRFGQIFAERLDDFGIPWIGALESSTVPNATFRGKKVFSPYAIAGKEVAVLITMNEQHTREVLPILKALGILRIVEGWKMLFEAW